jgi:hypothetical protein
MTPVDRSIGWSLYNTLDALATDREATTGDMLDVAAVILAGYMLRVRAECELHGADAALLARLDQACWTRLRERAYQMAAFLQDGTVQ